MNFEDLSTKTIQIGRKRNENHRWCTKRLFMVIKLKKVQTKNLKTMTETTDIGLTWVQFYKTETPHVKKRHPVQEWSKLPWHIS